MDGGEYGNEYNRNMATRFSGRWPWCAEFVKSELKRTTQWDADPDCRYIARRCKQRLISEIRAKNRMDRSEYMEEVERDEKGRFLPVYAKRHVRMTMSEEKKPIDPGRILFSKYASKAVTA